MTLRQLVENLRLEMEMGRSAVQPQSKTRLGMIKTAGKQPGAQPHDRSPSLHPALPTSGANVGKATGQFAYKKASAAMAARKSAYFGK